MNDKLILFDWGNIVESHTTGYSCKDAWQDLFLKCGYRGNETIFSSLSKYKLSAIKADEEFAKAYNEMAEDFNLKTTYEEFVNTYYEIFDKVDYYREVADFEHSLKGKCKIGILSNLTIFDKARLDKQVDLSQYDYVFLSFEMGLKKPFIEIFEEVQKQLPFEKKDILFIDDTLANIKTASEFGWNTLHATGLELDKIKKACYDFIGESNGESF